LDDEEGVSPKIRIFFEYVGFYFRRFFVKELWDSELGWMRYKLPKFFGRMGMRKI
jgi:hypothetical protein